MYGFLHGFQRVLPLQHVRKGIETTSSYPLLYKENPGAAPANRLGYRLLHLYVIDKTSLTFELAYTLSALC